MLDRLMKLLAPETMPLEQAKKTSLVMLTTTREMYHLAINAVDTDSKTSVKAQLARMDKQVNREQLNMRKLVAEYMGKCRKRELLRGMQFASISTDLERMGDYIKSIGELLDLVPGRFGFGPYHKQWSTLKSTTGELFELTKTALIGHDERAAEAVIRQYSTVATTCEQTLLSIFAAYSGKPTVPYDYLPVTLILLHMHRIAAHLKNICSALVNPYHRIGFRA